MATKVDKKLAHLCIGWMNHCDIPEVLQIEQASFDYSWTEEDFLYCLRQRDYINMVFEYDEKLVGFMIYELYKTKLHILNFAMAPQYRRLGIGRQIVGELIDKLASHRRSRITLAVRETNLTAQLFFYSMKFRAFKVLRGYYEDSGEDAFLMQYRMPSVVTANDVEELLQSVWR